MVVLNRLIFSFAVFSLASAFTPTSSRAFFRPDAHGLRMSEGAAEPAKPESHNKEERYGIIVTLKSKEGKMEELLELSKGHFLRQHDGREPNATLASIVMPLPDDPNTVRFFEQWVSKEDYELHSKPNENLQFFFDNAGPLLDDAPVIVEAPMIHFTK
mmetsp:Transcript_19927/g.28902  ORF Transcript_19927/g.28902 Transcript_19927/m.28902 type:complete len:158 (-) Transcript_19927:173-646(-)